MNTLLSLLLLTFSLTATTPAGGNGKGRKSSVTVEGEFRSTRGVMQPLSCYCNDGGYVTTASGEEINVCFEDGQMEAAENAAEKFTCDRIQVTGVYKTLTRTSGQNDPCPSGTMKVLIVKKFKCL